MCTEAELVKGKTYTANFTHFKEYLGIYDGIINTQLYTGYPGYSMTAAGREDMHIFPERQAIREKLYGYKSDACISFSIGHFIQYGITFEEGDTTKTFEEGDTTKTFEEGDTTKN